MAVLAGFLGVADVWVWLEKSINHDFLCRTHLVSTDLIQVYFFVLVSRAVEVSGSFLFESPVFVL